ncbi:MAG: DUF2868 domain-containing protein [Thioalkalivibrio sp.]|nr:DUF2868 domain-containing protein [Thioalkalivibrio sp.]
MTPLRQRLVAEALRLEEDRFGRILDDPVADARAREAGGDFEQRVVRRASETAAGRRFAETLEGLIQVRFWLVLLAAGLALLAGIAAAAAVFGQEATVNIGWALAALLGLQLLMLLLWILFTIYRPSGGGGALGRGAMAVAHGIGRRLSRRPDAAVLLSASLGLLRRGGLGRWIASALTHGLWAAFCLGALLGSLFALSVRQYEFVWGTTLLTEDSFVAIVGLLGAPAQWLGWPVPDEQVVRASRIGLGGVVGRELWSGLLLASIFFYGLLPRTVLAGLSLLLVRRAARRLRLDTGLPGYARLSDRLSPRARSIGVVDPDRTREDGPHAPPRGRPAPVTGPALLIGLELERDSRDWPPRLAAVDWIPLGRADDRAQRHDVLAALRARAEPPGVVLVVCSLARTPDRGAERFFASLREQTRAPVWAVLDEGHRLDARGGPHGARVYQWQEAGMRAGLDYVLEAELDDAAHPGTRELTELLRPGSATA